MSDQFALSASRILSYLKCSWVYYHENVLNIRDDGNDGSKRGSICHDIFEEWIKPEYKDRVDRIISNGSIDCDKDLLKLVSKKIAEIGLGDFDNKNQNNYEMICQMLYVGFAYDFYCDGWEIDYDNLEQKFELKSEDPPYIIRGLIDKPAKKGNTLAIYDYKSSQFKKTSSEIEFEIQALSYILFAKRELKMDAFVEFIFLRYPEDPISKVEKITDEKLKGFEEYLSSLYLYLRDFDIEKAKENFAADKGYPSDGTFSGMLCCGYAKYRGHSYSDTHKDPNKRGMPYYHCPFKFSFNYYSLRDALGNIITSSRDKDSLNPKDGEYITEEHYAGCPKFKEEIPN